MTEENQWGENLWGDWVEYLRKAKRTAIAHGLHFAPEAGVDNVWHTTQKKEGKIVPVLRVSGVGALYCYFCGYGDGYAAGEEHGYQGGMHS